jgi:MFS family permease
MNIHPHAGAFVIAAGAILGICAGLLWTAQGSLMLAYATENQKGGFIGIFWGIFNLGAVVGASVSLGQNFHSTVCISRFGFLPIFSDSLNVQENSGMCCYCLIP